MRRALPWRSTWLMYVLCLVHVLLLLSDVAGTGAMLISIACLGGPQVNNAVAPPVRPAADTRVPDLMAGLVCSEAEAPLPTSAISQRARDFEPHLQGVLLTVPLEETAWAMQSTGMDNQTEMDCSWLQRDASLLGVNASKLPQAYWQYRRWATVRVDAQPEEPNVGGSVGLPSSTGECSSLLLILALVVPPAAAALAPLLGLAAVACFSPTAWAAFRSYHVRSYVSVVIVAVGVSYYASSLTTYERLLPAGVLLAKMGVSQTAPQVLAWLSARRPQAGWRGLHEVQLFGYAGEREWI